MPEHGDEASLARARTKRALVLFVFAWVWLSLRAPAIVHKDTSRDLAFAADLSEGTQVHGHGAWSGFAGLLQGTSWIDFLALTQLLGLGIEGIERVLTTLLAATITLAGLGFARSLPPRNAPGLGLGLEPVAATVGALVVLALLPAAIEVPILWQPTLLPMPILLAHLCLWRVLRDGEAIDAGALGVFCALAFDVHLISLTVIWLALIVVPMACRRPWVASAAAGLAGLATLMLSSPAVLGANVERLIELGWLGVTIAGTLAVLVCGVLLRRRFESLAWEPRLRLLLGVELLVLALLVAASRLDATPSFAGRYLIPFLPAIGLAAALATSWASTRRSLLTAAALSLMLVGSSWTWLRTRAERDLPGDPLWRAADFDVVAAALHERELTWTELVLRLQGPGASELLSQLAARLDAGVDDPPRPEAGLLVLAYEPEDADAILTELAGADMQVIEFDDMRVIVLDNPARTDRSRAELCRDDIRDCTPVKLTVRTRVYQAHPNAWVGSLIADDWLREGERGEPRELLWRLPVRAGPAVNVMFSSLMPERCAWHIVASEGFELDVELPTMSAELRPMAEGALLISRTLDAGERACIEYTNLPPPLIETEPGWTQLRASLNPAP